MAQNTTTLLKRNRSSIRQSTSSDLAAIHDWLIEEKAQNVDGNFLCNWSVIEQAHHSKDLLVYIDGKCGQPVAFQLNKLIHPGILQVRKAYRGKGIGRKIVERCFSINRLHDECCLYIQCEPASSIPFWEHMGFTLINTREGNNYAYRIIDKYFNLPESGVRIKVIIRFFPESRKWKPTEIPFSIHEPMAILGNDGIVYLENRVSFHNKSQVDRLRFDFDVVVEIEINGNRYFLDKAKYIEAEAIGIRYCTNGFYIDKVII